MFDFHHAMIYVSSVPSSKDFYARVGFEPVEENEEIVRMKCPGGMGTISLHEAEGRSLPAASIRLYLETGDVHAEHERMVAAGIAFDEPPTLRPWGWTHAYFRDPDGHELSLYSKG